MIDQVRTIEVAQRRELLKFLPQGGLCAEVGVDRGTFSQKILDICKPDKLYLIDSYTSPPGAVVGSPQAREEATQKFAGDPRVQFIFECSVAAAATFHDHTFDWLYLDACHGYQPVYYDLRAWWPKIKPRGYMLGHDYLTDPPLFEVERAVDEFLLERGLRLAAITADEKWKSWAVQKPAS